MIKFKVIFFNAGGTLIQLKNTTIPLLYSKHLSRILKRTVSPENVYLAFRKAEAWALSRKFYYYLFSDMDQRKYQNAFYNELGVKGRSTINEIESELAEFVDFQFQLERSAKDLLRQLKKDYKIGLISNWGMDLYDLLESFDIQDYFDSVTISGEFGISKPSLEIFKSGLADFPDVRPKHTVYIGDDYDLDILPAQDLRMFPILFDKGPSGMHGWPLRPKSKCPRVEKLQEIPDLLKRFENKRS